MGIGLGQLGSGFGELGHIRDSDAGGGGGNPAHAYVAEDGATLYVAENGTTTYVQEA